TIAVSPDGSRLYVVHPDADAITILDRHSRTIVRDVLLADARPARDPSTNRYVPAIAPRALTLDSTGQGLFVTGQRWGEVFAIDASSGAIRTRASVCSEPIGVVVGRTDADLFVACSQDDEIVHLRASDLSVVERVPCPRKPWALAWSNEKLIVTHLLGP